ncbi:UNKNOWN [Stylonychia lemnae]|uniref:Uncharacterized protein n=1 Tax=Stylonychia lemnae TaxID=5949 RepID=A0A078AW19_STYLE|nr:UNKNOWN [Stylonychia lemnae]|eukprot:CDW86660.1 UNKNOWN [Stylonychia lemnae]
MMEADQNSQAQTKQEDFQPEPSPRFGEDNFSPKTIRIYNDNQVSPSDINESKIAPYKQSENDFSFSQNLDESNDCCDEQQFPNQNDQSFSRNTHQDFLECSIISQSQIFQNQYKYETQEQLQEAFKNSINLVEQKWMDIKNWPESSPLRIELFSLEMQAVHGSYYRNKIKVQEYVNGMGLQESNKLAYIESWKHKFRKTQKESMQSYVQIVEKNQEMLQRLETYVRKGNQAQQNQQQSQQSTVANTTTRGGVGYDDTIDHQNRKLEDKEQQKQKQNTTDCQLQSSQQYLKNQLKKHIQKIQSEQEVRLKPQESPQNSPPKPIEYIIKRQTYQTKSPPSQFSPNKDIEAVYSATDNNYSKIDNNSLIQSTGSPDSPKKLDTRKLSIYSQQHITDQKPITKQVQIEQNQKLEEYLCLKEIQNNDNLRISNQSQLETGTDQLDSTEQKEVSIDNQPMKIEELQVVKKQNKQKPVSRELQEKPRKVIEISLAEDIPLTQRLSPSKSSILTQKEEQLFQPIDDSDYNSSSAIDFAANSMHTPQNNKHEFSRFSMFESATPVTNQKFQTPGHSRSLLGCTTSPSTSRISRKSQKLDFSFKHYVTLQSNKENDDIRSNSRQYKLRQIDEKSQTQELEQEEEFEVIDVNGKLPKSIGRIDSQGLNLLEGSKDEMPIYKVRLDLQEQQYLSKILGINMKELQKFSILKSFGTFKCKDAQNLMIKLQDPLNLLNAASGDITHLNQLPSISTNCQFLHKTYNRLSGLLRSRFSQQLCFHHRLLEEDGLILISRSISDEQALRLKQQPVRGGYFSKSMNLGLQIKSEDDETIVSYRYFYCVDYQLLYDNQLKQNNLKVAQQDVQTVIEALTKVM